MLTINKGYGVGSMIINKQCNWCMVIIIKCVMGGSVMVVMIGNKKIESLQKLNPDNDIDEQEIVDIVESRK
ncbi:hypothetical protein DERF_002675 [Dermatophagoides farinae]|uniref:Uncharacterized protein n=1 Tax=Dermatophagoides farinae TaxID=6954 RepID=A0A922LAQ8_DERFA|nr:hypothetical protein DERF_002675 [Dermatophagoides farinae]